MSIVETKRDEREKKKMNQFRGKGKDEVEVDVDETKTKKNQCSHKICSISESKNDPLKEDLTKIFNEHPFPSRARVSAARQRKNKQKRR